MKTLALVLFVTAGWLFFQNQKLDAEIEIRRKITQMDLINLIDMEDKTFTFTSYTGNREYGHHLQNRTPAGSPERRT